MPIKAIANNAGADGAVVVGKLLEMKDIEMGYNAQTGKTLFFFYCLFYRADTMIR